MFFTRLWELCVFFSCVNVIKTAFSVFQTIALFIYLTGRLKDEGPFLILCPLSVLGNWKEEMERYRADVAEILFFALIKIFLLSDMWNMIKQHIVLNSELIFFQKTLTWGNVDKDWISEGRWVQWVLLLLFGKLKVSPYLSKFCWTKGETTFFIVT